MIYRELVGGRRVMSIMIDKAKCRAVACVQVYAPGKPDISGLREKRPFIKYPKDCWGPVPSCIKEIVILALLLFILEQT